MISTATVRKEVELLRRALAPKVEPEWVEHARQIDQSLREYEQIKKESGFYDLSPEEQGRVEMEAAHAVIRDLKKNGLWGPEAVVE